MATLIEITSSVSQEEDVQAAVETFCRDTSSLLIGRRVNEETHEALLMVQLPHTPGTNRYMATLRSILHEQVTTSVRYITCELVKISFHPSVNLQEQMRDFPLRPGESWFPTIDDPHQVYVCISRPLMQTEQAAWLLEHEVEWAFVR